MTFQFPSYPPVFWPVGPSDEMEFPFFANPGKNDDSFESLIKVTPDSSFTVNMIATPVDLTPPSKCSMRRDATVPRVMKSASFSSFDTIQDQLQQWSSLKLNTSSESNIDVRDLVFKTTHDEPLFTSRLIHEFKENYDIPVSPEEARRLDAEHVLRQTQWKYHSAPSKASRKRDNGGGSPDTATTAPPSFSTDDDTPSHVQDNDDEEVEEREVDISAITTEQDHYVILQDASRDETLHEPSPPITKSSPTNTRSHLDGLRQLLWPEPLPAAAQEESADQYLDDEEYDTFDQYSFAGTHSTSTMTFLQHVTCCAGLLMPGGSRQQPATPGFSTSFASRSEEDTHLIMDSSVGSFLYLDEDEEGDFYGRDDDNDDDEFRSVFDAPELGTSVKQMAKMAMAVNCSHISFEHDLADEHGTAEEPSFLSQDASTLQDSVNLYFLNAQKKAAAAVSSSAGGEATLDDEVNKSGSSSYASGELMNEFYTLDESSCDDEHTESAVSEASMVTTPRKNSSPDDTMSTRSNFTEEDMYDEDDDEPPPLRLTTKSRSIASYEDTRFLC